MTELFLNYTDENGDAQRVAVDKENFVIGRHSENDLCIANVKLSRRHLEIQRFADVFVAVDKDSSNGSKLNDADLEEPEAISNGDVINLGGGLSIEVEIVSDDGSPAPPPKEKPEPESGESEDENGDGGSDSGSGSAESAGMNAREEGGSGIGKFFLIAPLLLIFVLLIIGGAILLFRDDSQAEVTRRNSDDDFLTSTNNDDDIDDSGDTDDNPPPETPEPSSTIESNTGPAPSATIEPVPDTTATKAPENKGLQLVEQSAVNFMRRIARDDPRPVLTTRQLEVIQTKINQYKGSSALAGNIRNARSNSASIQSMAQSKNLKPQFLANAALAKLGKTRGNVVSTAQTMLVVLDKLNIQIGDEVADESVVTIAAYRQGVAGEFLRMRNTMESLASKNPTASSRQVRTIWYLRDKGKLTNSEFEFALRFIAIGAISQNPRAFGLDADALRL